MTTSRAVDNPLMMSDHDTLEQNKGEQNADGAQVDDRLRVDTSYSLQQTWSRKSRVSIIAKQHSKSGIPSMAVNGMTSAGQFYVLRVDQEQNAHVALPGSKSTTVQGVTQHRTLASSNYRRHLSGYVIREAAEHPAPAIVTLLDGVKAHQFRSYS